MPDTEVKIEVRLNGNYRVYGPFKLIDQEGNEFEIPAGQYVALCRCGQSDTKPFCNGNHRKVNFNAPTLAKKSG